MPSRHYATKPPRPHAHPDTHTPTSRQVRKPTGPHEYTHLHAPTLMHAAVLRLICAHAHVMSTVMHPGTRSRSRKHLRTCAHLRRHKYGDTRTHTDTQTHRDTETQKTEMQEAVLFMGMHVQGTPFSFEGQPWLRLSPQRLPGPGDKEPASLIILVVYRSGVVWVIASLNPNHTTSE